MRRVTPQEMEAFLDEALPPGEMAALEAEFRDNPTLLRELAAVSGRRDAGMHTLGEIWRRRRLSCPAREQLGSYVLGVLAPEQADFIAFHVERSGCRYCQANLADLQNRQQEQATESDSRRRKYFQTSAGLLRKPAR